MAVSAVIERGPKGSISASDAKAKTDVGESSLLFSAYAVRLAASSSSVMLGSACARSFALIAPYLPSRMIANSHAAAKAGGGASSSGGGSSPSARTGAPAPNRSFASSRVLGKPCRM